MIFHIPDLLKIAVRWPKAEVTPRPSQAWKSLSRLSQARKLPCDGPRSLSRSRRGRPKLENRCRGLLKLENYCPMDRGRSRGRAEAVPSSKIVGEAVPSSKNVVEAVPSSKITVRWTEVALEVVPRPSQARKSLSRPSQARKSLPRQSQAQNYRPTDWGRAEAAPRSPEVKNTARGQKYRPR